MAEGTKRYDGLLTEFFEAIQVDRPMETEGFTTMEIESLPVRLRLLCENDSVQHVAIYVTLCELTANDAFLWHRHLLASNLSLGAYRIGAITMLPDSEELLFVTSIVLDDQLDGRGLGDLLGDLFKQVVVERDRLQRTFENISALSGIRAVA